MSGCPNDIETEINEVMALRSGLSPASLETASQTRPADVVVRSGESTPADAIPFRLRFDLAVIIHDYMTRRDEIDASPSVPNSVRALDELELRRLRDDGRLLATSCAIVRVMRAYYAGALEPASEVARATAPPEPPTVPARRPSELPPVASAPPVSVPLASQLAVPGTAPPNTPSPPPEPVTIPRPRPHPSAASPSASALRAHGAIVPAAPESDPAVLESAKRTIEALEALLDVPPYVTLADSNRRKLRVSESQQLAQRERALAARASLLELLEQRASERGVMPAVRRSLGPEQVTRFAEAIERAFSGGPGADQKRRALDLWLGTPRGR